DHYDVDLAALDIRHQTFQPWPICVATGETGVIVVVGHRNPALGALAGDVSVTRLLLRIDGVELLVKPFIRGHTAVDGAAFSGLGGGDLGDVVHRTTPLPVRPKNNGPDQCAPVMCRATAVRLLKVLPSYSNWPAALTVTWCSLSPHSRSRMVPGAKANSRGLARSLILECFAPIASRRFFVSGLRPPKASSCNL